jgi:outer membrane protein TolC
MHMMGNYEINNYRFASDGQDSWSVGVVLNLNLFNGGADRARIVEAQANHQRAVAQRERIANAIGLEVHDAFLAHQTARERVTVAREAVGQADESLRIVRDRYDAGLTTIVELLDSETALTAARTNLTRTLYDATVSQARLDLSLGRLDRARLLSHAHPATRRLLILARAASLRLREGIRAPAQGCVTPVVRDATVATVAAAELRRCPR